jgi:glutamyl-tRNA reductase
VPKIEEIKAAAVIDLELRLHKILRNLPLEEEQRETLKKQIDTAEAKVVNKMLFGLRDTVSQKTFRECVEGLEKIYEK